MKRNALAVFATAWAFTCLQISSTNAVAPISNFRTLTKGCYQYTDVLKQPSSSNEALQASALPDAFLGKQVIKVDCNTKHHLEIGFRGKAAAQGTVKLDTVLFKSQCLIRNNSIANSGHENHASQLYVFVWRVGKVSNFVCGVNAKSSPHPTAPGYKFYEVFYSPVLDMSK